MTVLARARPRRQARITHDDAALASFIAFVQWDREKLLQVLAFSARVCERYDHTSGSLPSAYIAARFVEGAPSTYELGDFEGIVGFHPLVVGDDAQVHFLVWGARYKGHPLVLQAILRDAFKRWSLRRVTSPIPSRNTLGRRNLERLGFKLEGTIRKGVRYNGGEDSVLVYGLLEEEAR